MIAPVPSTRLFLVRHAPVRNDGAVLYGRLDVPLASVSTEQLARCARHLPANAVWIASTLRRARDTAAALQSAMAELGEIGVEDRFSEQDFGDWEGRRSDDVWADLGADQWAAPAEIAPPNGESFAQVFARAAAAADAVADAHPLRSIVAVCHAGPIRAAVASAMGANPAAALKIAVEPLSVTRIDRYQAEGGAPPWSVVFVNRV